MQKDLFPSSAALGSALGAATLEAANQAIAARGVFTLALTGGSAAQQLYPLLAQAPLPWQHIHVFLGDERCVPTTHADSNARLARETLLSRVNLPVANLHLVDGAALDIHASARAYEADIRRVSPSGELDLVHLGMGPDGHVCSLFPGHAVLRETSLVAALADSPKPPPCRITLTLPALYKARALWFLVMGASKDVAVRDAVTGTGQTPATVLSMSHPGVRWWLDQDAARLLR
jgi:6-phosphogluconolactonase